MANGIHKDLGKVTAYSYAKAAGYTGTEEQFQAIFNEFTENAPGLIDRMDTAVARAEAAVTNIDATVQDAVDNAVEEATASAVATANQAVTDAQAAQTAAEGAVTQANNAVTQANAAVTAAQAAQSAAEDAAESIVLDRTLTDSGAAAPADLVGDLKAIALDSPIVKTSGNFISFMDGVETAPVKELILTFQPIQSGTGSPSLDNTRPISGRNGVTLYHCGRNMLNADKAGSQYGVQKSINSDGTVHWEGTYSISTNNRLTTERYLPAGKYYIKATSDSNKYPRWDGTKGTRLYPGAGSIVSLATGQTGEFGIYASKGTVINEDISVVAYRIGQGSGTEFERFKGDDHSFNWEEQIGSVYAGTYNIITGEFTIIPGYIASYNGETLKGRWISDRDVYSQNTTPTIGAQVFDFGADPVTYHLTPQEIKTFNGANNFFVSDGNIEITYVGGFEEKDVVPAYYYQDSYIYNKINTIRDSIITANGNYSAFIFLTDAHWESNAKHSPAIIRKITENIMIPRIVFGGDMSEGIDMEMYKAYRDAFLGDILMAVGNHEYHKYLTYLDTPTTSFNVTDQALWAHYNGNMKDVVIGNANRNYYYVDDKAQKNRYIVLNTFGKNNDSVEQLFEQEQQTWLENTALDLPNEYTALIFAHELALVNHDTGDVTPTTIGNTIASIVDNFSGNGEIAALISGHRHFDGLGSTSGGTPIFITTCDKYKPASGYDDWLADTRTKGTITEQAFDVFVVNKTSKTVTAVRIGCPADNPTGSPLEIRTASY